ncbi:Methyltransferase domain-containing protein [Algoriphagus faecimaris]|uniref:site-specific DNA-methyltransferase (adenine-specific) n=1 Tax=Algoriphagus faecimaris TaxID=686796 RepID=A0A1G6TY48_9BACT|nr:N-6 DNA methylase [Algoriphagus faecimaris]SDD33993.1 Methyltransferase domain-containing protein [Algoriphagus faecimaris]
MTFPSITIQGNILSTEILDKISKEEIEFQRSLDFGLKKETKVRDEIGLAYAIARGYWNSFRLKLERLTETEAATTETRNLWMIPFLTELGYTVEKANQEVINGKTYAITHRAQNLGRFPIHIVGFRQDLDKKDDFTLTRISSHGLVQEYLNVTDDHLYALITNGKFLRILRDSSRLAKLAYVEFNLEKIFEEDLFSDFAILYRLLHASRMPQQVGEGEKSIMEQYHQISVESGNRIRENLRMEVKNSLNLLGSGFLNNRLNPEFVQAVLAGKIESKPYFDTLLRTIYRLLFLIVAEERKLIFPEEQRNSKNRKIYFEYYSIERLRQLAMKRQFVEKDKHDLWEGLKTTFKLFESNGYGKPLGIEPLGGDLFSETAFSFQGYSLHELRLTNQDLLQVIANLTLTRNASGSLSRVNYSDLDVEELGSVYEGLLELHPLFYTESAKPSFGFTEGSERKLTGSYYTRHDLVAQLIKTSLIPLIEERLQGKNTSKEKEAAILSIKVCDPATGSGHFLLAAARVLAYYLAVARSREENPGEKWMAEAKRDVIQKCIYGVDLNPAAVELCRLSLWIEGHNSGKPLSFLEHKIKNGNALVGVDSLELIKGGIPDGAFKETTGDEKEVVKIQKKVNSDFRKKKQFSLFMGRTNFEEDIHRFAESNRAIDAIRGDSLSEVEQQKKRYEASRANQGWMKTLTACNLYTYAFFQPYSSDQRAFVNSEFLAQYLQSAGSLNAQLEAKAFGQSVESKFFHWVLEFPEVTEKGGFDLILANPPWERIKLQEKEFFMEKDPEVANAANAAARKKAIQKLQASNPKLWEDYLQALHESESSSKFVRESGRFPLAGRGDVNTYSVFSELIEKSINDKGAAGFIVPTGIATDDTNKFYFADLIEKGRLASLFDFENKKAIFANVHRSYKFSLITLGPKQKGRESTFGFFMHDVLDILDRERVFTLGQRDFLNINPNTKTTPIFRTRKDSELTAKIYNRVPVMVQDLKNQNRWKVFYMRLVDLGDHKDSVRFSDTTQFRSNRLYESKMIWQYDHRYSTFDIKDLESLQSGRTVEVELNSKQSPDYYSIPRYLVDLDLVDNLFSKYPEYKKNWIITWRDISNSTNERTTISTIIPKNVTSRTSPGIGFQGHFPVILVLNFNSLIFDYLARQKIGGVHLNWTLLKQLPVFPEELYSQENLIKIIPNAFELIYCSWDIKAFADDHWNEANLDLKKAIRSQWEENQTVTGGHSWKLPEWKDASPEIAWEKEKGCPLPPFKWDEARRARLKAELDAYFALLYGLERDELRYILDPQDVYGEDFPGETFRVLKEKDIRKYGEYRTRRLVLEAYDCLRPDWDMEAHLQRLQEIWEECQEDLTPTQSLKVNEPRASYGKKKAGKDLGMKGLFD